MEVNKEERKKAVDCYRCQLGTANAGSQKYGEAKSSNKFHMTDLWGPETLYLWTGRAFISSSVIDGVVGTSSLSSALNVS